MGVLRAVWPIFKKIAPSDHIFGIGDGTHYKFRVLIDTEEY